MSAEKVWYADGLKFTCTQCGDCCTGAPGFVWVVKEEVAALAAAKQMTVADFEEQYVRKVGARRSLTERPNGDCDLLDPVSRKCTVYDARPRQCKTWPFWDSNLKSPETWQDTCEVCPGSGQGKLYNLEAIETQRKIVKV